MPAPAHIYVRHDNAFSKLKSKRIQDELSSSPLTQKNKGAQNVSLFGASGEIRTHVPLWQTDFESAPL